MMREVSGAFFGSRKLDEALEDLKAEGITGDRVRVANMSGFADFHASLALSASSPTQWITAEFAGQNVHVFVDESEDDILPSFGRDGGDTDIADACALTRVVVRIRDEAEMRAVCDIFSRLGTDDIDAESASV
jgi:hypothetical protein